MASRPRLWSGAFALALAIVACGKPAPPTGPTPSDLPLEFGTVHFRLHHDSTTSPRIADYASALEGAWTRITGDLGQSNVSRIEGRFHPSAASFTAATGYNATGSVSGPTLFHVVGVPFAPAVPVHEFAHNVTLHLNSGAANNPVWLWESVAVYEAGQYVPPVSLPYLVAGQFPTLAQLNDRTGSYSIYDVGYVLTQFMLERWGWSGVRTLILSNGNLTQAFGLSTAAFEREWRDFVILRYLGGAQAPTLTSLR
jgi:hypothetical protein